jgi:hypothetical protein
LQTNNCVAGRAYTAGIYHGLWIRATEEVLPKRQFRARQRNRE